MLPPPISTVHERGSRVQLSEKEKLILVIGRFNVRGHNKCQLDAVRAFVELKQRAVLSSDWKLVVAGHVNPNPDNETYVEQCRRVGLGHRVEVRTNISIEELCELYRRASFLWQFTGIELPFGVDPSKCEHLGLVALDCFGYGVVPVVYQRSGVAMMLNSGQNGFVFGSTRDLAGLMGLLGTHWKAAYHQQLFNASLKMGREFSHAKFVERVGGLVY